MTVTKETNDLLLLEILYYIYAGLASIPFVISRSLIQLSHGGLHMIIVVLLGFKYPQRTSTVHLIFARVRHVLLIDWICAIL